jgi:hypothetical protein
VVLNDIGFYTYQKILQEVIEELKENEFKRIIPNRYFKPKRIRKKR